MALVLADRVQETTTTAGTGTLTLGGAVNGFQTFAVVGNTNTCYYTIVDGSTWEVGIGTYSNGATGATQAAGPTSGSWATNGSLTGSNISWYSASDTGYVAGDYVLLFDQTAGSGFFYYGQITLIQFAGGFGFAFSADIISSGGTPNGDPSSSWIMQESIGITLARTTVLSNSSGTTSPLTLSSASKPVFLTYPAEKSVNLNASGNVSPLGTVASGTWQGSTVATAYGGTGVTTSTGANSNVLRDANGNITANNVFAGFTSTATTGGTTVLTAASTSYQRFTGTLTQTVQLPDATTLSAGFIFTIDGDSSVAINIVDAASGAIDTIYPGGVANFVLLSNGTVAGTWIAYGLVPSDVDWGTNTLRLSTTVVTGGTWQGGTITGAYGGTGLTTFSAANNAVYSTGSTTLTAGTLPVLAGGTGTTTGTSPYATAIAGGGAYQVVYQTSAGVTSFVTNGTTGQVLTANTGAAPTFQTSTAASKSYAQAMRIMGLG